MKNTFYTSCLLFLSLFLAIPASAQYDLPQNKVWVMGTGVGLDFNGPGDPVAISTHITGSGRGGCVSVADNSGQLLFYSNGSTVWTAAGSFMPHGGLIGGILSSTTPSAGYVGQGSLIVPVPEETGKYYLFTLQRSPNFCKLYCNLIDMSLNNGQGDVDTGFSLMGVLLADSLSGKLTSVHDCDQHVWVLVHDAYASVFRAFQISPSGIDTTPVVSDLGNQMPPVVFNQATYPAFYDWIGTLKASPDGSRLVLCNWTIPSYALSLYHFDYMTGAVSNPNVLSMAAIFNTCYDAAFSPDGTKLYASNAQFNIVQYNLNNLESPEQVVGSTFIASQIRLGPDGKIYFGGYGVFDQFTTDYYYHSVGRINYPDSSGTACGFQDSLPGVDFQLLSSPGKLFHGLPNEVLVANSGIDLSINLQNDTLYATPTDLSDYQWYYNDSLIAGANAAFYPVSVNGWYSVMANSGKDVIGCSDSAYIEVTGYADTGTGIPPISPLKDNIKIYPNPAHHLIYVKAPVEVSLSLCNIEGKVLLQSKASDHELNIETLADGLYFLRIADHSGALIKVEKVVKQKE